MKSEGHPDYVKCQVTCSCGNSFETRSVMGEIKVAVCNMCHPFYTGTQKIVDTQGRVDRFKKRYAGVLARSGEKK